MGLGLFVDNTKIGGADIPEYSKEILDFALASARCGEGLETLSAMAIAEDNDGRISDEVVYEIFEAYDSCDSPNKGYFNGKMIGILGEFLNPKEWRNFRSSGKLEWELDSLGYKNETTNRANELKLRRKGLI